MLSAPNTAADIALQDRFNQSVINELAILRSVLLTAAKEPTYAEFKLKLKELLNG